MHHARVAGQGSELGCGCLAGKSLEDMFIDVPGLQTVTCSDFRRVHPRLDLNDVTAGRGCILAKDACSRHDQSRGQKTRRTSMEKLCAHTLMLI